jgi:hypothetical protein
MTVSTAFKRLILRAVLRNVSPIVIRVIAVPDSLHLHELDEVFRSVLGWENIGFIFHLQGLEFNSFRRATRLRTLREFQLRPSETFLYTCGAIDLWEWEMRVLDQEAGREGEDAPLCVGGRGATPPQHCGGPTGYRLMLKRQKRGEALCTPVEMEAVLGLLAASDPEAQAGSWQSLREALHEGLESIDRRLQEYGPLEPERFRLEEANQRLAQRENSMRWRRA